MAKILKLFAILPLLLYSVHCTDTERCEQKSPCLCEFSEYSKIDLSKVVEESTQNTKGFLKDEKDGLIYYFHGCTDHGFNDTGITPDNKTWNVVSYGSLIVQNSTNKTDVRSLGNSSQIQFNQIKDPPNTYELIFHNGADPVANVRLICDNFNQPFIKVMENTSNAVQLVLSSPHACIITNHPGMSAGSVLLLLAGIFICLYLILGACYSYFLKGARGLELIPNIDFWRSLPGLVKDGVIFLFSGCHASVITTADTYDRI